MFTELDRLIKKNGHLTVSHGNGGGIGLCWTATLGGDWPYCSSSTIEGSLQNLISTHLRIEKAAAQKRINEIDASSCL